MTKRFLFLLRFVSFLPVLHLVMLAALVGWARMVTGHFPRCNIPGPKEFTGVYGAYFSSLVAVFLSFLFWPILLLLNINQLQYHKRYIILYLAGITVSFLLMRINPFGLLDWLAD